MDNYAAEMLPLLKNNNNIYKKNQINWNEGGKIPSEQK